MIDQEIFVATYFLWLLISLFERIVVVGNQGKTKERGDRGSFLVIYLSILISFSLTVGLAVSGIGILPDWVFYLGILMVFSGILIREWAAWTLRGLFSYRVRVREDHRVVDSGPYKLIRHPAYTGSILTILGWGFAFRSGVGIIVLLIFCFIAYGYRIKVEEKLLVKRLGKKYERYMKRTMRIVPKVI